MSLLFPLAFVYLRHGETDWNREGRLQGGVDTPLNASGIAQAGIARELLGGLGLGVIYHSPLVRARATAEIVNQALDLPMVEVGGLREASFGAYEGTLGKRAGSDWYGLWKSGRDTPPGGEAFSDFVARALAAMNCCLADAKERGLRPLIVAHGGVYWAVRHGAGLDYEGPLANALPRLHLPAQGPEGLQWRVADLGASTTGEDDDRDLALR